LTRAREKACAHKMACWASATRVTVDDDDDGEWGDDRGKCSSCDHWDITPDRGITDALCPICKDTGFMHESIGVRRVWQAHLGQDWAARMTWRQE
jgi:hypothetical protein